jgi:hypothetical protein
VIKETKEWGHVRCPGLTPFLLLIVVVTAWAILQPTVAQAEPTPASSEPWEKFSLSLGAFLSKTNTNVRVGSGVGVDVDLEKALGQNKRNTVFRAESLWRFSHNRKHRIDASWFAMRRSATKTTSQEFNIKDRDDNLVTIPAGTQIDSHFNLDIIETLYSYSFLQDDRVDLAVAGGFFMMPIDFGLNAAGFPNVERKFNFTAPMPALGLRMDVALTPKWYIRSSSQIFDIEYENISGQLTQLRMAVECRPVKHLGIGVGVDNMKMELEASKDNPANIDLSGNIKFQYTGLQLYGKFLF